MPSIVLQEQHRKPRSRADPAEMADAELCAIAIIEATAKCDHDAVSQLIAVHKDDALKVLYALAALNLSTLAELERHGEDPAEWLAERREWALGQAAAESG
jgi:hypothetical protein